MADTVEGAAGEQATINGLPKTEDVKLDPIEIDVGEDGDGADVTTEVSPSEESKSNDDASSDDAEDRPRRRAQPRIAKLANERDQWAGRAQQLENELKAEREGRIKAEAKAAKSDEAAMLNYEARVQRDLDAAKAEYRAAVEQADPDKQTDANAKLAAAAAAMNDINAWKDQQKANPPAAKSEPEKAAPDAPAKQHQTQQPPADLPKEVKSWIAENKSWWSPDSPDFDEEAHVTTMQYAAALENQYNLEGRENEVNGKDYWDKINRFVSKKFPDYAPKRSGTPPMNGGSAVASSRGSTQTLPGQKQPGSSTKIPLTSDERQLARSLTDQGALKYPIGHKLSGQRMSHTDAEIHFARQKQANPPRAGRG